MSSSDSSSYDSLDKMVAYADMIHRPPSPLRSSGFHEMKVPSAAVTAVTVTKFQEPSGGKKKIPVEFPKITSSAQKEVVVVQTHTTAPVTDSKKKPATHHADSKKKPVADSEKKPATHHAESKKNPHEYLQTHTTAPVADSNKEPDTHLTDPQNKPREYMDIFSHPSHQPQKKKEKKIREKLGLPNLEFALSQASLDESKAASATSDSTTVSFLQATVARAKAEIKKRDHTIMELLDCQTSSEMLTTYVPPLDEKRVYLGKESPSSKFKTKNHRLHYLNIIPQHC